MTAPHGDDGSARAIVAAFLANLGIALAKFVAFAVTGAASMLAEGVHSIADTSNQGLLLLGTVRAKRGPTPDHPFGFGRERYFWALVAANAFATDNFHRSASALAERSFSARASAGVTARITSPFSRIWVSVPCRAVVNLPVLPPRYLFSSPIAQSARCSAVCPCAAARNVIHRTLPQ